MVLLAVLGWAWHAAAACWAWAAARLAGPAATAAALTWLAVLARAAQDTGAKTYNLEQRLSWLAGQQPWVTGQLPMPVLGGGTPAAQDGTGTLYCGEASAQGWWMDGGGLAGALDRSRLIDTADWTLPNTATHTRISSEVTIPPGSQHLNAEYEIEIHGHGVWGGVICTFWVSVGGTEYCTVPIGGGLTTAGTAVAYSIRAAVTISAEGAGGACHVAMDGTICYSAGNRQVSTGVGYGVCPVTGDSDGAGVDTTTGTAIHIRAAFASTVTGQYLTTYKTRITKRG